MDTIVTRKEVISGVLWHLQWDEFQNAEAKAKKEEEISENFLPVYKEFLEHILQHAPVDLPLEEITREMLCLDSSLDS